MPHNGLSLEIRRDLGLLLSSREDPVLVAAFIPRRWDVPAVALQVE
jgi:hypothetical protein